MRDGVFSFTALAVACARGIDDVDPVAASLMPFPLSHAVRAGRDAQSAHPALRYLLRRGGLVAHLPLRTLAIDAVVERAIAEGARQLVILGAGLDARAWRMECLAETRVLEVDHPATQAYKARRMGGRPTTSRDVRWVAVDFGRDDLGERIRASGFEPGVPAVFVWEGVTPYLPPAATAKTLGAIAGLCAAPGTLAMTYGTPDMASAVAPIRPLVRAAFGLIGEPLLGLVREAEARAMVEAAGMTLVRDSDYRDWATDADRPTPRLHVAERLLVARIGA
jgi:methyltransferase (TIGR00027 family)